MSKTWTVVYRTGGTENAKWHKTLIATSKAEAMEAGKRLGKMGYAWLLMTVHDLNTIGLPEGYDAATWRAQNGY